MCEACKQSPEYLALLDAVQAARDGLKDCADEICALHTRLASYRAALEWYEDEDNYGVGRPFWKMAEVMKDFGKRARDALAAWKEKP